MLNGKERGGAGGNGVLQIVSQRKHASGQSRHETEAKETEARWRIEK
jgi:hypothetical protein